MARSRRERRGSRTARDHPALLHARNIREAARAVATARILRHGLAERGQERRRHAGEVSLRSPSDVSDLELLVHQAVVGSALLVSEAPTQNQPFPFNSLKPSGHNRP